MIETLSAPAGETPGELAALAAIILGRHRSLLRELRIEAVEEGVVLHGRSATFYGKQVALHEALNGGLAVVANHIVVAHRRLEDPK